LVSALLWRVRGTRAGRHGRGGNSDGRRSPDIGQGPGGRPVRPHGGDRPKGRLVQRSLGLVPLHRFGGVRRRVRVHRRPVLGVRDKGWPWRQWQWRKSFSGRKAAGRRRAAVTDEVAAGANRPNTHHGHSGERTTRPGGYKTAVRRPQLKDFNIIIQF